MFTVTFYSFKGGVGRTLSMMNAAYRLSERGKTVFILDFDLEAPGVDVFFPSDRSTPGLLDCIARYTESGSVPPLEEFVSEVSSKNSGRILCMSAGRRDQNYQTLLAKLNWKDFYARHHGFYFVENLKAAIQVLYRPDYVLVDSRTGLTDISGICTLQLPDLVVLLFGLNDQNLIGTAQIYRTITHNTLDRSIQTLLVASPVPDVPEFVGIKKERLKRAKDLLGSDPDLVLPFNAFVAFKETIIPSEMGEFLNQAYDTLCERIISCNNADVSTLLREARRSSEAGDSEQARATYQQILEANAGDPVAWAEFGSFLRSLSDYTGALEAYREAEKKGAKPSIYGDIAVTLLYGKEFDAARKQLSAFLASSFDPSYAFQIARAFAFRDQSEAAIEAFEKLAMNNTEIGASASGEIGNLYLRLGRPEKALPYYEGLVEKSPNRLGGVYNMGAALSRLGRGPEARQWFQRAIALFERTKARGTLPGDTANLLQAMSQAYAANDAIPGAIALLNEAIAIAQAIPTGIFSSIQYRNVSPLEFIEESRSLLAVFMKHAPPPSDVPKA